MKFSACIVSVLPFLIAVDAVRTTADDRSDDLTITINETAAALRGRSSHLSANTADDSDHRLLQTAFADFCWKSSYGRGAGVPLNGCPAGRERIGLLCYTPCPSGFARFGFDCHQQCPSDSRDDGLYCRWTEYGRGGGYPWKFGDPLNDSRMFRRCENDHGVGNCQDWGPVVYPKCKEGYSPFGCCICRPNLPDCAGMGFNHQLDLSCAKSIIPGDPTPMICAEGLESDGVGLCHKPCRDGFNGVGPVCWAFPPPGWVDCGFGAASSAFNCGKAIADQVQSVAEIGLFAVSLGQSGSLLPATAAAKLNALALKFPKAARYLRIFADGLLMGYGLGFLINDLKQAVENDLDGEKMSVTDAVRLEASILSIVDPTGASSAVAAYTYDTCDTISTGEESVPPGLDIDDIGSPTTNSIPTPGPGDHWSNSWNVPRTLGRSGGVDPNDCRVVLRGSGSFDIVNGIGVAKESPRLYIFAGSGWGDIDVRAYAKVVNMGVPKSYSGFTFGARSNHDLYKQDGCSSFGYYARIYWETGELAFQKEYYHDESKNMVYSLSNRVNYYLGGVPTDKWIGMRFTVITNGDSVELKLYLDEDGTGNWILRHSMVDSPGSWNGNGAVPSQCQQNDGDPVLRAGNVCFLRTDGSADTEVHWSDAHISDLSGGNGLPEPRSCWCQTGTMHPSLDYCCDTCDGRCGGSGCSALPGGASRCCSGAIGNSNYFCTGPTDTACIVP